MQPGGRFLLDEAETLKCDKRCAYIPKTEEYPSLWIPIPISGAQMTAGAVVGVLAMDPAPVFQATAEMIVMIKAAPMIAPVGECVMTGMESAFAILDSPDRTAARLRAQILASVAEMSLALTKMPV